MSHLCYCFKCEDGTIEITSENEFGGIAKCNKCGAKVDLSFDTAIGTYIEGWRNDTTEGVKE